MVANGTRGLRSTSGYSCPSNSERQYELDWLRVLAILWAFAFHAVMFVPSTPALVRLVTDVGIHWRMPIVFAVAGATTALSLRSKSPRSWLSPRLNQLLWPLAFGMLVLLPAAEVLAHAGAAAEVLASPRSEILHADGALRLPVRDGSVRWEHLWFIWHLAIFAVLTVPLHRFAAPMRERLGRTLRRPASVLLLAAPLVATALVRDRWGIALSVFGLWQFHRLLTSLLIYSLAFLLADVPSFWEAASRQRRWALALALLSAAAAAYAGEHAAENRWMAKGEQASGLASQWFGIVAAFGYGRRYLGFTNRFLAYAAAASYPMYVLHQFVLDVIAARLQGALPAWAEFPTALLVATALSLALYETLVKRSITGRLLLTGRRPTRPIVPPRNQIPADISIERLVEEQSAARVRRAVA